MVGSLILGLAISTAQAHQNLFQCNFGRTGDPNHFSITFDIYGEMRTAGLISIGPFDCNYELLKFSYSPESVKPFTEFYFRKKKCTAQTKTVDRTHETFHVTFEKSNQGIRCETNLVINSALSEDAHPFYDGKEVKRIYEKFKAGLWP